MAAKFIYLAEVFQSGEKSLLDWYGYGAQLTLLASSSGILLAGVLLSKLISYIWNF